MIDSAAPLRVYVHLPPSFDAQAWNEAWERGDVGGVNDPYPYGYHRAEGMGCTVTFSGRPMGPVARLLRLALGALTGFDLVHAWRHRARIRAADIVWTHTEAHGLGVAAVLALTRRGRRPALLLQSVWLVDRWHSYPAPQRWLFARLVRRADVLTFHTDRARDAAGALFPGSRCATVHYGLNVDGTKRPPRAPSAGEPTLLAIGNDVHRDWETTVAALRRLPEARLTVVSHRFPPALAAGLPVEVVATREIARIEQSYRQADALVLALAPNLHASGLTVLQEAALLGLPAVVTDVGGLTDYFDETMVTFVPPGDPEAIAAAVRELLGDPERARQMAVRAQDRMSPSGISSEAFVRRHVELSREVLGRPA